MLTTAIPDNGLQLYRTSYAVRSAITATAELLLYNVTAKLSMHATWTIEACLRQTRDNSHKRQFSVALDAKVAHDSHLFGNTPVNSSAPTM